MLIDRSYFIGELNIPGTDKISVQENLDLLIQKREPELLKDILGFDLYKAFTDGLTGSPVDPIWMKLLTGTMYTDRYSRLQEWRGIVSQPPDLINAIDAANALDVVVGGPGTYDPAAGISTTTIPSELVGKPFIFEKRSVGKLRKDEYGVAGPILSLVGTTFSAGDTYTYKAATLVLNTSTGTNKDSPIANYVYYWFMRREASQTTQIGEVATKSENSVSNGSAVKMARAWNELVERIWSMAFFLDNNREVYPLWKKQDRRRMHVNYRTINNFNL